MLEILLGSVDPQPPTRFVLGAEKNEVVGGESSYFSVADYDGYLGAVFFWALEGPGSAHVTSAKTGSFTVSRGTTLITYQTKAEDGTIDLNDDIYLVIRSGSPAGFEVARSENIPVVYTQHPIGQESFITVGTFDFVVPDDVTTLAAVAIGGGQGAYDEPRGRGGHGGDLRWRNNIEVTPGETLTITVGEGGLISQSLAVRNGGSTEIRRGGELLLCASGGGREESTEITLTKSEGSWVIPINGYVVGGGKGGIPANGIAADGPSGGGGAGGYLGDAGRGGDLKTTARAGQEASGAAGGGAYYYTSTNDSHHATAGGGVGLFGRGRTGEGGIRNDPPNAGGQGGSSGVDGTWVAAGLYGGGAKGRSSNNSFGSVNGANGAARLIWGVGRRFPATKTGNL